MNTPGIAVVGAGLMGTWHARAARRAGAQVLAVVDPDRARAEQLIERHRPARSMVTLAEALDDSRISAVHICTPPGTHAALALQALSGGAHVLMEKPFTDSLQTTRDVLASATLHDRLAVPVHQFGFQAGVLRAVALRDEIGPLRHIRFLACSAGAQGGGAALAEQVAVEILPHPLSLVARFLPRALGEVDWQVQRPAPGEWLVNGVAGAVGIEIVVSMAARPPVNELCILGERGTIHIDLFHGFAVREPPHPSRRHKIWRPILHSGRTLLTGSANLLGRGIAGEVAYPGLGNLVRAFYSAIAGAGPSPIASEETLAVAEAWAAVQAAAHPSSNAPPNELDGRAD